ncbi:anti-sigma factor family protein [Leifsonia sp. NPDC058292]|uniref:anti-sigma factor family protein n=1 Tax=Leifsonia sp. NPDC058292 TaxID=3346428 RepID=UPI0036D76B8D
MTTHDEFATWDGAYLLGALSTADRRDYEEHLRTCVECSAAVAELAGVPGLLGRVPVDDAFALLEADEGTPEQIGDDVLPALLSAARRRRLRTRWVTAASVAAALVVVTVGALVLPSVISPAPAPQAGTSVVMRQVEPSALTADLRLIAEPWGTRIQSRCSYAAWQGAEANRTWTYAMVVTDRGGKQTQISTWTASAGSTVHPVATTSVPVDEIASIDIRSAGDGTVLLRSSFG